MEVGDINGHVERDRAGYSGVHISSNVGSYRGTVGARRGAGGGGIPPEEFLRSSVATWRIGRVLVAPSGG